MSLYESEIDKGTGSDSKRPVTTISIYVDDKPYFLKAKSDMMKIHEKITDAEVTRNLIQTWFYKRNDSN